MSEGIDIDFTNGGDDLTDYVRHCEEMECPTPCNHCHKVFDLHDGYRSQKWHRGIVICPTCHEEEEREVELEEEVEDLRASIEDAEHTIKHARARLIELGVTIAESGKE